MADQPVDSAPVPLPPPQPKVADPAVKAMSRYRRAYRAATFTSVAGTVIKVLGLVFGFGVAILEGYLSEQLFGSGVWDIPRMQHPIVSIMIASGVLTFGAFLILGILVSAMGRQLKAALDTAVHSSPFVDIPAKAALMKLDR